MEIFIEEVNNGKSEVISVSLNSILTCNDLEGKYKEIVSEFYSHLIDEKLLSSLNNKIDYPVAKNNILKAISLKSSKELEFICNKFSLYSILDRFDRFLNKPDRNSKQFVKLYHQKEYYFVSVSSEFSPTILISPAYNLSYVDINDNYIFSLDRFFIYLKSEFKHPSLLWDNTTKESSKHTYVMIDKNTNLHKIGKSDNILYREKTLQSEKPTIELLYDLDKNVESELHKKFKDKRVRGEWFDLDMNDLEYIKTFYKLNKKI